MEALRVIIEKELKEQSNEEWLCQLENNEIQCIFREHILLIVNSDYELIGKGIPFRDSLIVKKVVDEWSIKHKPKTINIEHLMRICEKALYEAGYEPTSDCSRYERERLRIYENGTEITIHFKLGH